MASPAQTFGERPKKTGARKRAKIKAQKRRLIASGMNKELVEKMDGVQARNQLKNIRH